MPSRGKINQFAKLSLSYDPNKSTLVCAVALIITGSLIIKLFLSIFYLPCLIHNCSALSCRVTKTLCVDASLF